MESTQPLVSGQPLLKKESIAGGPVSCVSFLSNTFCWVARGCFIELSSLDVCSKNEKKRYTVFPNGGTIHGVQHEGDVSVVFGGRQLAILHGGKSVDDPIETASMANATHGRPHTTDLTVSDWIWNIKMIVRPTGNNNVRDLIVAVALANNACEIWRFRTADDSSSSLCYCYSATRIRRIVGMARSITYSMCFHGWNVTPNGSATDLIVASGTVSNEILVWTALDGEEAESVLRQSSETETDETLSQYTIGGRECCLRGHLGVIHAVCFDETGELLASASDDRSVRLWQRSVDNNDGWALLWTGWSHSARVWNVAFSRQGIVSCGEDASAKIRNRDDGSLLGELHIHSCQSLWSIDVHDNLALVGCNDGTAKLWDLSASIVHNIDNNADEKSIPEAGTTLVTCQVPDDRCEPTECSKVTAPSIGTDNGANAEGESLSGTKPTSRRKKKAKVKVKSQTICGMEFYNDRTSGDRLLVATRAGSLFSLHLKTRVWQSCEPWWVSSLDMQATDGSCIAIRSKDNCVAIGTTRGDIVLVRLETDRGSASSKRLMYSARQYLSIKRVAWLDDTTLLSFHIKGIVLVWAVSDVSNDFYCVNDGIPRLVLNTTTMAVPTCFSRSTTGDNLFVGDSRGNITLFPIDTTSLGNGLEVIAPASLACRVHKKEYVNDICCLPNGKIISVGNDGCLRHSIVNLSGELESTLSIPLSAMPGPMHIYRGTENTVLVAGYHGNCFLVLDIMSGYELFRVDTGGRQRTHCCIVDASRFVPVSYGLAICASRTDGLNDIVIQSHLTERCQQSCDARLGQYSSGISLHGEPVFDLCLFKSSSSVDYNVLLSGSEDCTARVSIVRNAEVIESQLLPTQSSCIRAVCSSRHSGSSTSLLVVSGGQTTIHFYTLLDSNEGSNKDNTNQGASILDNTYLQFIGTGYYPFKPSMDPRINAVRSVPIGSDCSNHVVVTGDSDGGIHIFKVSDQSTAERSVKGQLLFSLGRPVLSLEVIEMRSLSSLFVVAGTTDGFVSMWVLPIQDSTLPISPLGSYEAHQVGTNSISAFVTMKENDCVRVQVCSGGDDQSIAVGTVHLLLATRPTPKVVALSRFSVASASAIKGVKLIDADHFLSVGYSQRLALWRLSDDAATLRLLSTSAIDVADINSFSTFLENDLLVVGGMGIEILTLAEDLCPLQFPDK